MQEREYEYLYTLVVTEHEGRKGVTCTFSIGFAVSCEMKYGLLDDDLKYFFSLWNHPLIAPHDQTHSINSTTN